MTHDFAHHCFGMLIRRVLSCRSVVSVECFMLNHRPTNSATTTFRQTTLPSATDRCKSIRATYDIAKNKKRKEGVKMKQKHILYSLNSLNEEENKHENSVNQNEKHGLYISVIGMNQEDLEKEIEAFAFEIAKKYFSPSISINVIGMSDKVADKVESLLDKKPVTKETFKELKRKLKQE